jgi:methyl-accepting chemotaxis protein
MRFGRTKDRHQDHRTGGRTPESKRAPRFRWTIGRKVAALGLGGLCVALAAMLIQRAAIGSLADASERTATTAAAVRAGMQATAKLDALRGDVYLGMIARDPGEARAALMTLQQDGRGLLTSLTEARQELDRDATLVPRLDIVRSQANRFVEEAGTLGALAVDDRSKAIARQASFEQSASDLEGSLGDLTDVMQTEAVSAAADANVEANRVRSMQIWFTAAVFAGLFYAARLVSQSITRPLGALVVGLDSLAEADLTAEVGVKGDDEVARLGRSFNRAVDDLSTVVRRIRESAWTLASSAEELSATSTQMGASAEETSAQAHAVSSAAEQVSANVNTVAASAEEMSASIHEIAASAHEAAAVAGQAVETASATNETVRQLGDSSAEIGLVIKVITAIAEQTNLLALNATIEAARAGEAGKGFAVVANEVKELAKETSAATEEIGQKIEAIQGDARAAMTAIDAITEVIGRINDIQGTIASAVEQQTATTNEITRHVTEAAGGAGEIAANVTGVAQAAQDTSSGASSVQASAQDLARLAEELNLTVSRFIVEGAARLRRVPAVPTNDVNREAAALVGTATGTGNGRMA